MMQSKLNTFSVDFKSRLIKPFTKQTLFTYGTFIGLDKYNRQQFKISCKQKVTNDKNVQVSLFSINFDLIQHFCMFLLMKNKLFIDQS